MVIGSRFLVRRDNMPIYREAGIRVINWLFNIGSHRKLTDTQSCFRAYNRDVLSYITVEERDLPLASR